MDLLEKFKRIKTFVFDVDGVLTDGTLFVFPEGQFVRRMNIKDGYALQLAVKKGYRVIVISGGQSDAVSDRLHKLGVHDVYMQVHNKKNKLLEYVRSHNLHWEDILFMGDDIPDYEVMQQVGMPCAPADAALEIKSIARYIATLPGGQGCAREVIEKVLKLNDHWDMQTGIASK